MEFRGLLARAPRLRAHCVVEQARLCMRFSAASVAPQDRQGSHPRPANRRRPFPAFCTFVACGSAVGLRALAELRLCRFSASGLRTPISGTSGMRHCCPAPARQRPQRVHCQTTGARTGTCPPGEEAACRDVETPAVGAQSWTLHARRRTSYRRKRARDTRLPENGAFRGMVFVMGLQHAVYLKESSSSSRARPA